MVNNGDAMARNSLPLRLPAPYLKSIFLAPTKPFDTEAHAFSVPCLSAEPFRIDFTHPIPGQSRTGAENRLFWGPEPLSAGSTRQTFKEGLSIMRANLVAGAILVFMGILIAASKSQGAALNPSSLPEIQDALNSVEEYSDGEGDDLLEDTPDSRSLWVKLDRLKNRAILTFLHRNGANEPISTGFSKLELDLSNPLAFNLERVGKDAFIASTQENVILLLRRAGALDIVWSARRDAGKYAGKYPFLKAWGDAAKFNTCVRVASTECGRMAARFGVLPDTADGHHRFILDGLYWRVTAPFLEHQFSIWEWNGRIVKPSLARAVMGGQDDDSYRFEGNEIHVPFLLRLDMPGLSPTAWVIRVGPDRLEDLGIRTISPEQVRQ